ncbi:MAG: hypothetical protein SD837_01155 [Candidatus Electrothrix scaldis]|nr:MAG: hypothetical protein SD837_01155 [Candidatus Electrothrix sp. GW3-3]
MNLFELRQKWLYSGCGAPECSQTTAQLAIYAENCSLTKNENIWSQSVQESIVVSTYPLALWMLQSWWRLLYEPLPVRGRPATHWRMAHELGAVGHGFVWPKVIFASDSENVQIWASPSDMRCQQSVRYLNGLHSPVAVPVAEFENVLFDFVSTVISRLDAVGVSASDLSELFKILQDEQQDGESFIYRKLEALMGFDPDECPLETMHYAVGLLRDYGEDTLSELAPMYGKNTCDTPLKPIEDFITTTGIFGKPTFSITRDPERAMTFSAPWKLAVEDAHRLRKEIGNETRPISTGDLFDFLGVASSDIEKWEPKGRVSVSVGIPTGNRHIKFVPRKKHPVSRRFELSRYIGDFCYAGVNRWLTNTDLGTARQKYQRAFGAEFLCPIQGLIDFLQDDFSDEALDDAAEHFEVSQQTITSLLANNHVIEYSGQDEIPYQIGFSTGSF